jgi:hypothetical protein
MAQHVYRYDPPPPTHGPFHSGDPVRPPYVLPGQTPTFYPLTVGRAASLSFSIYRFAWRTLVPISVLTILPSAIATAIVGVLTYQQVTDWEQSIVFRQGGAPTSSNMFIGLPFGSFALILVVSALVGIFPWFGLAALTNAIANVVAGQRVSTVGSLRAATGRWRSLLAIYLLILAVVGLLPLVGAALPGIGALGPSGLDLPGPIIFVGLIVLVALVFALVFVAIRVALVVQSLMIESIPASEALRRSWMLVTGSMWRLIGWAALFGLIVGLLSLPFTFVITLIAFVISPPHLTFPAAFTISPASYFVQSLLTTLVSALLLPLVDIGFVLLYFDLRFRKGEKVRAPLQQGAG